jgi:ABC-type xylose transport system permease subunit
MYVSNGTRLGRYAYAIVGNRDNVPAAWQDVLKGIVLVMAVFADVYIKRNR